MAAANISGQNNMAKLTGWIKNQDNQGIEDVLVYVRSTNQTTLTNRDGYFSMDLETNRKYTIAIQSIGMEAIEKALYISSDTTLEIKTLESVEFLSEVVVRDKFDIFGIRQLRSTEGGGLYEGKKTEVVNIDRMVANKALNNARQAFSKISGLNIWESDNAGLQLDIGGRGLSPKRTSNFNTRQNGYDISADALGYPESYYTPPFQAVRQIEVVRGAGALQYGSQFGGMVNFQLKNGSFDKPLSIESQNTFGAYGLFNTYNAFHGQVGKLNHYSYFQFKRGDGWRDNAGFDQLSTGTHLSWNASKRLTLSLDFSHMHYLSQQSGGLTDEDFESNPQFSNRERNWFRVDWNLPAFSVEYKISPRITLYSRAFGLIARRTSLGLLSPPEVEDPATANGEYPHRDLIDGKFQNIGNENRLTFSYGSHSGLKHNLLLGTRIYRGLTNFSQKLGTTGKDANFTSVDTALYNRNKSDFQFPNFNAAFFAENVFRITPTLSIIPGIRYEYIQTRAQGSIWTPVPISSFRDEVIEQVTTDTSDHRRHIFLYGLGLSNKLSDNYEIYANATANYRAVNFTDVQIQTNNQVVDPNIEDESGYSFDIGLRKRDFSPFYLEAGLFYIWYDNRIGEALDDGLRVRTNIGSAQTYGAELFVELDALALLKRSNDHHRASIFFNGTVSHGTYTKINPRAAASVRSGNKVEDLPSYNLRFGANLAIHKFSSSVQASYVGKQYSDAANTEEGFTEVFNTVTASGIFGPIPAYGVWDWSAQYEVSSKVDVSLNINNVFDHKYFTRRATAYPGPGIIPAQGRTWNLTLSTRL